MQAQIETDGLSLYQNPTTGVVSWLATVDGASAEGSMWSEGRNIAAIWQGRAGADWPKLFGRSHVQMATSTVELSKAASSATHMA